MIPCLLCHNAGALPLEDDVTGNDQPIKRHMITLFGEDIIRLVQSASHVCNLCGIIIETIARFIESLMPLLARSPASPRNFEKPLNLQNIWTNLMAVVSREHYESRVLTPSLVEYTRTENYDEMAEEQIAYQEQLRSLSRVSSTTNNRSDLDSEVSQYFPNPTKKKRRRKKRLKFTRRKISKYSDEWLWAETKKAAAASRQSYNTSFCTKIGPDEEDDSQPYFSGTPVIVRENHIYCNGTPTIISSCGDDDDQQQLDDGCKSRAQSAASYYPNSIPASPFHHQFDIDVADGGAHQYECVEADCTAGYDDLDTLTEHCIRLHNKLALFVCPLCKNKFTIRSHLNDHRVTHHRNNFMCEICRQKFDTDLDYKVHWQIHVKNSVKCDVCDKRYFNHRARIEHSRLVHVLNVNNNARERTQSQPIFSNSAASSSSIQPASSEIHNNSNMDDNFKIKLFVQDSSQRYII